MPAAVIDDAVLILSELLSNSCRYARPLAPLPDLAPELAGGAHEGIPVRPTDLAPAERAESGAASPHLVAAGTHRRAGHRPGPAGAERAGAERAAEHRRDSPAEHRTEHPADQPGGVLVRWQVHSDGLLTLEVTDGGAATRPVPASPSLTAKGGRGLSIVDQLAVDWGVRDAPGEVTVWAALPARVGEPVRRSA
ncbi:ATP-binding protein [Kitasatospora sp. LaBMicrA B282]|uniref:ATP-binding protein n=1 Tax=Kitasatospora sp. LaBMicrA B282 TaxID=3420949 RepID=UPI003D0DC36E